jgi:hypothetical protein
MRGGGYFILLLIVFVSSAVVYFILDKWERFEVQKQQQQEVRTKHGSSPEVKALMADLHTTTSQLKEDSKYDTIDMTTLG